MARILLIDDEPLILESLQLVLADAGHDVEVERDGKAGIETLKAHGATFDLVISDVVMPEMDGLEVLMEIRTRYPGLKVIIISGGGRLKPQGYQEMAGALGADATLTKPFSNADIKDSVQRVLN